MDALKMLAELRQERDQLEEAILVLERLASGGHKRRGRPPAWMSAHRPGPTDTTQRKRKPFSAATKRKMAESQKRRWAELRKAEAKG
jgi:hypothetical protein